MTQDQRVTVSRRSALRSGGLAAIMASLLPGAVVAEQVAEDRVPDLASALCGAGSPDRFRAFLSAWRAEHDACRDQDARLTNGFRAQIGEEAWRTFLAIDTNRNAVAELEAGLCIELMIRHLPGLEPVLRLLWTHALETTIGDGLACGDGDCRDGQGRGWETAWRLA